MPHLWCCIDVEASGPVPGLHDLVSIGAVAVQRDEHGVHAPLAEEPYYVELQPQGGRIDPGATAVHGLSPAHLAAHGRPLDEALRGLNAWAEGLRREPSQRLVFVGHNAPFDWSFVNWCYVSEGVPNPFGWKALDTKALAMGVLGLDWFDTNKERLAELLPSLGDQDEALVHRADYDALYQARILCGLLDHAVRSAGRCETGRNAGRTPS
jgi:DNA polymerase III epsilon subunit-like protein